MKGEEGAEWPHQAEGGDKITSCDAILNISGLFLENSLLKIDSSQPSCNLIGEAIKRSLAL